MLSSVAPLLLIIWVEWFATTCVWFDQLVQVSEVQVVRRLVILRVSVDAGDLLAFELDPAVVLRAVFKYDLDLDHLIEAKDDLGWVPRRWHLSLKATHTWKETENYINNQNGQNRSCIDDNLQYIDLGARLQGLPIQIVIRVRSLRNDILSIRILTHFLSDLEHLVQLFNSLFAVIGDPVDLTLVDDLLLLIDVLPVDDAIAENLQTPLVVWEARILSRHRHDQVVHVLALWHFLGEGSAPLC